MARARHTSSRLAAQSPRPVRGAGGGHAGVGAQSQQDDVTSDNDLRGIADFSPFVAQFATPRFPVLQMRTGAAVADPSCNIRILRHVDAEHRPFCDFGNVGLHWHDIIGTSNRPYGQPFSGLCKPDPAYDQRPADALQTAVRKALPRARAGKTPPNDHILNKSELQPDAMTGRTARRVDQISASKDSHDEKDRSAIVSGFDIDGLHGKRQRCRGYPERHTFAQLCQRTHADSQRVANAVRPTVGETLHLPVGATNPTATFRIAHSGKDLPTRALTYRQGFATQLPYDFHHLAEAPCDVHDIATASAGLFWGAGRPELEQMKDRNDDEIRRTCNRRADTLRLPRKQQRGLGRAARHAVRKLWQRAHENHERVAHAVRATSRSALHLSVSPARQASTLNWPDPRRWVRPFACALTVAATPAMADPQSIAPGAQITPAQVGHIFDAVCFASTPTGMEDRITLSESAFFLAPADLGTDFGYENTDASIQITLDGNPIEQLCTVTLAPGVGGDGAELYESVESHLSEHLDGSLPSAEYTDGGVVWQWDGSNASFTLTYSETDGAFTLSLLAEA